MSVYYRDDLVTLYHGDCLEIDAWLTADVLVTDPPYGIGWSRSAGWKNRDGGGRGTPAHAGIQNDRTTAVRDAALARWDGPGFVFGTFKLPPVDVSQVLIYAKPVDAGIRGCRSGFRHDVEAIYMIGQWPVQVGGRSSVLTTNGRVAGPTGMAYQTGHPHTKPVDLLEQLIDAAPPGVIADPFAGSGSTLVAARNLGRRAIGVELEERYCETVARRLAQGVLL